jgi:hypothetical protein
MELSAVPRSTANRAAAKKSHRNASKPVICRNSVRLTISAMNFRNLFPNITKNLDKDVGRKCQRPGILAAQINVASAIRAHSNANA